MNKKLAGLTLLASLVASLPAWAQDGIDDKINAAIKPASDAVAGFIFTSFPFFGVQIPFVLVWLIVAAMLLAILPASASAQEYKYTSERDCSRCHKKKLIGNQTKVWKGTKHAKAFATLKGEKALEIAKERGMAELPHESDDCLGCPATAYGIPPEKVEKVPMRMRFRSG